MYSKAELIERGIMPRHTKYGGNILIEKPGTEFVPRQYLTAEEWPRVPLSIQVLYSYYPDKEGNHHRLYSGVSMPPDGTLSVGTVDTTNKNSNTL